LEVLTHSSRNHGVAAAEKGSPDGREVALSSATAAADLVLPKSINGRRRFRRAKQRGIDFLLFFSARREGERLRGRRGRYYSSTAERSPARPTPSLVGDLFGLGISWTAPSVFLVKNACPARLQAWTPGWVGEL
jgi:hypothetical protein